jgi:hypothetical protein
MGFLPVSDFICNDRIWYQVVRSGALFLNRGSAQSSGQPPAQANTLFLEQDGVRQVTPVLVSSEFVLAMGA